MSAPPPSRGQLRFPLWGFFALMTAVAVLAAVPYGLYIVAYLAALLLTGSGALALVLVIETPCVTLLKRFDPNPYINNQQSTIDNHQSNCVSLR